MDEITQGEDQGWKLGNNYLKGSMEEQEKSEGDRKSDPRGKRRTRD